MNTPRLVRSTAIAGAAALLVASTALGGDCKPPQEVIHDLSATSCLFGDPRARENIYNEGNVSEQVRITYRAGRDNRKQKIIMTMPAGSTRTLKLWAHGQTWVRVRNHQTGELLTRIFVDRSNISQSCPLPTTA